MILVVEKRKKHAEYMRAYRLTEKGQANEKRGHDRWNKSEKGKAYRLAWAKTEKGKALRKTINIRRKKYYREWREKNAERIREKHRKYYDLNREWLSAKRRESFSRYAKTEHGRVKIAINNFNAMVRGRNRNVSPEAKAYIAILRKDPCSYCGGPGGEIDHIVPLNNGGTNEVYNLTASCRSCNARKRDRSLVWMLTRQAA